jgi:formate hydrogenlyase transcriptional activator
MIGVASFFRFSNNHHNVVLSSPRPSALIPLWRRAICLYAWAVPSSSKPLWGRLKYLEHNLLRTKRDFEGLSLCTTQCRDYNEITVRTTYSRCTALRIDYRPRMGKRKSVDHSPAAAGLHGVEDEVGVLRRDQAQLATLIERRDEFYRGVLDSLAEGVIITDSASRIIFANRAIEEVTGFRKEELLGQVSYKILAPKQNWAVMQRRLRERLLGKVENYEHELVRKDGTLTWISVRATPYRNARGEIVGTVGAMNCIDREKKLERQNEYLLDEIRSERNAGPIVGPSAALAKVLEQIAVVAPTCANVLILGESGTGKELVARAIHEKSGRKNEPLVRVNCASIPKDLFESEFFGHVRGAFTGAVKDRAGRFELANGGTLFLDEVGEIPLDLQGKLLRVLQEGQFERVGEDRTRTVDIRLVTATNRELLAEAKAGRFRLDLYYRLSVFPIEIPPLRDRREDIVPLAAHFLAQAGRRLGLAGLRLSQENIAQLQSYDWPGNVRELQNVIERAVILARGGKVHFDLGPAVSVKPVRADDDAGRAPDGDAARPASWRDLKIQERSLIEQALKQSGGRIYGPNGAAAIIGLRPTTLASKIQRLGLRH